MKPFIDHKSAFNSLALCAVIVMPPYIGNLPLWLLLTFAGLIAWRYHINQRRSRAPGRTLRIVLLLLMIVLVLQQFGTVFGRDAGISLLTLLLGLKFLELRTQRDYVVSTLIYYVLILGNFLYAHSIWLALYLAIAVVACTATLMQVALQTTTSAAYRFRYAGGLLIQALPLMLLMYFLFPRIHGGLWGLSGHTGVGISGMSDELRLGEFNHRINNLGRTQRERTILDGGNDGKYPHGDHQHQGTNDNHRPFSELGIVPLLFLDATFFCFG